MVLCMQMAYWHQIQTLLVVGLDHDYFDYKEMPQHFNDDYVFKPLEHPQMLGMMMDPGYAAKHKEQVGESFARCRDMFEADGRRIINLTEGSQYDGFERGKLEDWVIDRERPESE